MIKKMLVAVFAILTVFMVTTSLGAYQQVHKLTVHIVPNDEFSDDNVKFIVDTTQYMKIKTSKNVYLVNKNKFICDLNTCLNKNTNVEETFTTTDIFKSNGLYNKYEIISDNDFVYVNVYKLDDSDAGYVSYYKFTRKTASEMYQRLVKYYN